MENLNINLRKADIDDARGIAEVHVKTWKHAYKGQIPDMYLANLSVEKRLTKWNDILIKNDPEKANFVAELEGRIIGFCSVGPTREAGNSNASAELYSIYVDPEYAGKGAGSMLMKECLQFLKQKACKKVTLRVLETNTATREFYERKGWIQEGLPRVDEIDGLEVVDVLYGIELS